MQRLRVGDEVIVVRGNDKGKRGKVTRVLKDRDKVVVEGVNSVKRHIRATPQRPGGILEVDEPIPACKVMPVDPEGGKPTRVRYKTEESGKVRVARSGAAIVTPERS
jgi:large subunit ribosomal protein L24